MGQPGQEAAGAHHSRELADRMSGGGVAIVLMMLAYALVALGNSD
jgi:hypothetical protein